MAAAHSEDRLSTQRILVMDDEDLVRDVACSSLESFGYLVDCVQDGADAVKLYEDAIQSNDPYGAVVLDLTVPGGFGAEKVLQFLQEIDPGVKAIIISGHSNHPVVENWAEYGFSGSLAKPYTIGQLLRVVDRVLEG